jgi:hypothetical protein
MQIRLGPPVPTLPFVEGELYKTAGESATIQVLSTANLTLFMVWYYTGQRAGML